MKFWIKSFVLLMILADEASCNYSVIMPLEKNYHSIVVPPKDKHGRYAHIGNLGGKAVAIPGSVHVLDQVHYKDDIKINDYGIPVRKKRIVVANSYNLPIRSFDFDMRIADRAIRSLDEPTERDWLVDRIKYSQNEHFIDKPFPWARISVYTIKDQAVSYDLNPYLQSFLHAQSQKRYSAQPVVKQPVYGLTYFDMQAGEEKALKSPDRKDKLIRQDVFADESSAEGVRTVIHCDKKGRQKLCHHHFLMPDMRVEIWANYNRSFLPHWQEIQKNIIQTLNEWVVDNEGRNT